MPVFEPLVRVTLSGGPADGVEIETFAGGLQITGHGVPEGWIAFYWPTPDKSVYRFGGLDKIIATTPAHGSAE
jgi:hypothetical protein